LLPTVLFIIAATCFGLSSYSV